MIVHVCLYRRGCVHLKEYVEYCKTCFDPFHINFGYFICHSCQISKASHSCASLLKFTGKNLRVYLCSTQSLLAQALLALLAHRFYVKSKTNKSTFRMVVIISEQFLKKGRPLLLKQEFSVQQVRPLSPCDLTVITFSNNSIERGLFR